MPTQDHIVSALIAALEPFAKHCPQGMHDWPDHAAFVFPPQTITLGALRRAWAALALATGVEPLGRNEGGEG